MLHKCARLFIDLTSFGIVYSKRLHRRNDNGSGRGKGRTVNVKSISERKNRNQGEVCLQCLTVGMLLIFESVDSLLPNGVRRNQPKHDGIFCMEKFISGDSDRMTRYKRFTSARRNS